MKNRKKELTPKSKTVIRIPMQAIILGTGGEHIC